MGKLNERVALVTGGGSGIGRAIAGAFAAEGARLILADRDEGAAHEAATEIGDQSFGLAVDVATKTSVVSAVEAAMARAGRIDVLVNSAGVYGIQLWPDITVEEYRRLFDVNVLGVTLMTQAVSAHMIAAGRGNIINIASAAGRKGNATSVLYAASKAAVINLTQSAALAFAVHGIRANALAPGRVQTPMWEEVLRQRAEVTGLPVDTLRATMSDGIPLGRMSTPQDYVAAALYLASDDSAYMTGQTLNIDGGLVFA